MFRLLCLASNNTKVCSVCKRRLPLEVFGTQKYASGNVAPSARCKQCIRAGNAVACALSRARKKGLASAPDYSTRVPYVPPVNFLPMAPPREHRELVATI